MPHGFNLDVDDDQMLKFSKRHKNGEITEIQADNIATSGSEWLVNVKDPNGGERLGRFGTKKEAKRAMKQWMNDNPKGVPASGRDISVAGGGIPGMNGNGLF